MQLKSYAGVDIETYHLLSACLEKTEANKQSLLSNRIDCQRQYGGGCKERLTTIDDKLFSSCITISPILRWTL